MAGASKGTPSAQPPSLQKSNSSSQSAKNQRSIMGFFQKKSSDAPDAELANLPKANGLNLPINSTKSRNSAKPATRGSSSSLTPAPSSDAIEEPDEDTASSYKYSRKSDGNGLPSPVTPISTMAANGKQQRNGSTSFNSPSRKAKKVINYAESEEEDDEDILKPSLPKTTRGRALKRRKTSQSSEEEDFAEGAESEPDIIDEGKSSLVIESN